jgi:hypothetical protein
MQPQQGGFPDAFAIAFISLCPEYSHPATEHPTGIIGVNEERLHARLPVPMMKPLQ